MAGAGAIDPRILHKIIFYGYRKGKVFAIDGCRLPSNAGKEWSGTHEELRTKAKKIKEFPASSEKKTGSSGEDIQSNITG
jgi:hypothetical protein